MTEKVHNSPAALGAKLKMREKVLELVTPAHVFDAFCGPVGEMHGHVWHRAASYVGVDKEWRHETDARRRFVADNMRVLRAIDLQPFNVFDLDAFGSPWPQMTVLLAKREWAKDEIGAVVLTDGSGMKSRFGGAESACALMAGLESAQVPSSAKSQDHLFDLALGNWLARARVKAQKMWRSDSRGSGKGGMRMLYAAVVFKGLG
jgi:hypothetical protein